MEEDPLIPLVHVWTNAAFDHSSWPAPTTAAAAADDSGDGDKENQRPKFDPADHFDVDAEIEHIEAEILRLSSRLHHLRTSKNPEPKRDATATAKEVAARSRPRPRGLSLGPLDIPTINPILPPEQQQQQQVAVRSLKPIKQSPVARRRGTSLGPLEIHHGVGSKPAAERAKPFPNKLSAIREGGQPSKQAAVTTKPWPSSNPGLNKIKQPQDAKQGAAATKEKARRSASMSPNSRRQSIAKPCDPRGGVAAVGGGKMVDDIKGKGVFSHSANAASGKRPSGSSKVRVVASRYSLTPAAFLGAGLQEKRRKQSLPVPESTGAASQRVEIRAKVTELPEHQSPQSIAKVAELLPRIKIVQTAGESPRDSGCAKRVADLVGKRSFFTAAAGSDDSVISSYQAGTLEDEVSAAAAAEA